MTSLVRSHLEKYAFLFHILVVVSNYIATVYANMQTYYCCWFDCCDVKSDYSCMTSLHYITLRNYIMK